MVKRIDSYGRDMMIKIIYDVMKSDWPEEVKKHILLKELLWKADAPRGVRGDNSQIIFSKRAMSLWKNNKTFGKHCGQVRTFRLAVLASSVEACLCD